jgi:glycosyltransferase involved in cell wall biosynthesis
MNILILNWRDLKHPLAGGAEVSLTRHAQYWLSKGENVTWFSAYFDGAKEEEVIDGVRYIRRGNHYTVFLQFFLYYLRNKPSVDTIIDCFHFVPFFTPLFVRRKKIIALIHEVAGDVWFENLFFPFALMGYLLEPFFIRLYGKNLFITVSDSTKKDLEKIGIKKKNIRLIHNGVSAFKLKGKIVKEKLPTLVFLGRLSKDKGIEDALLMVELLKREHSNLQLWIIGKFENKKYERRIKRLLDDFKVKKYCTLYGYVNEDMKGKLLKRAWLLIHPSVREGWGLNVIEANSVGTPAIGYNVQGLRDSIINGKTGLLVEPDAISLANGVEDLILDKEKLRQLSRNSIEWSKNFSWEVAVRESYKIVNK